MVVSGAPDFTLRLAGPGDAAQVLTADVFDFPARAGFVARFLGAGAPDPRCLLVLAEQGGRVVGFASGAVLDHPDKPPQLFVQELGVNEAAQGRGIGRALVARLRAEGRARGCTATWVLTEDENAAARATYRAAGGQETTGILMVEWDETAED